jgi:hypothetical protein
MTDCSTVRSARSFGCVDEVLWAALGEDYPRATVPHHHDTTPHPGRMTFRDEIAASYMEMNDLEAPADMIERSIALAVDEGWIRKDDQGFWLITGSGHKALFPFAPVPKELNKTAASNAAPPQNILKKYLEKLRRLIGL